MNREIKFRAWDKEEKIMREVSLMNTCRHGLTEQTLYFTDCIGKGYQTCDKAELMQYTGLKDKNGVKIYEGDAIVYKDGVDMFIHKVMWDDNSTSFIYVCKGETYGAEDMMPTSRLEVIGNIYENPELLEGSR